MSHFIQKLTTFSYFEIFISIKVNHCQVQHLHFLPQVTVLLTQIVLLRPTSLLSNGYQGSIPGGKAQPGRDADQSPPFSANVKNEYEVYLLSP
jgi:hypothetical protein